MAVQKGEIAWRIPCGDRDRIASCLGGHLAETRDHVNDIAILPGAAGHPAVTVTNCPPGGVRERAADQHRRMRLLHRLRPGLDRIEADKLTVVFRRRLGPYRPHRLDGFPGTFMSRFKHGAVVFDLLLVPAVTNAEQDPSAGDLVDL